MTGAPPSAPHETEGALAPGATFARYRIEELLGEGGMGRVYRAHDTRLRRTVALKVLSSGPAERLLREARAAAALHHPNVVAVHDVGEHAGIAYIVMELVEGKTLRAWIGDPQVPVSRRLRWLADMARGIAAAHARGLVHRDIKPSNVIVCNDDTVKLLDFGVARRTVAPRTQLRDAPTLPAGAAAVRGAPATQGAQGEEASLDPYAGSVVGTPRFMSPEQASGGAVDERSDQFSWAVVAYELLTGVHPWGEGPDVLQAIRNRYPTPLRELAPDVPDAVEGIVLRAMAKKPEHRFASMAAVVEGLATTTAPAAPVAPTAAKDEPSGRVAMESTLTERRGSTRRRPKRSRWLALGAGLCALGAVATALVPFVHGKRPHGLMDAVGEASTPARASYVAAMQSFHDGNRPGAILHLQAAVDADPTLACAHLRLAVLKMFGGTQVLAPREHYEEACALRTRLGARDADVLQAFEPLFRDPPDLVALEASLSSLLARHPGDAEIAFYLGQSRERRGDADGAYEAYQAALAADPTFKTALGQSAAQLLRLGRDEEALGAFERCLTPARRAPECLGYENHLFKMQGRCDAVERNYRDWYATDPSNVWVLAKLADASFATGAARNVVDALLEKRVEGVTREEHDWVSLAWKTRLAVLDGDLAGAEALAIERRDEDHTRPEQLRHSVMGRALADIYVESGRTDDAVRVAEAFLRTKGAWQMPSIAMYDAIAEDATPMMLDIVHRAGRMDDATFAAERDAWVKAWEPSVSRRLRPALWIFAYASTVATPEEARSALAELPRFGEPGVDPEQIVPTAAHLGRTLALGGHLDEGIARLRQATHACEPLLFVVLDTRSRAELGRALEQKGDRAGACAEYGTVLGRWGDAHPRSVTAEWVRARATALGCGP